MDGCNGTRGDPGDPGYGIGGPGFPGPAVSTKLKFLFVTLCTSRFKFRDNRADFCCTW